MTFILDGPAEMANLVFTPGRAPCSRRVVRRSLLLSASLVVNPLEGLTRLSVIFRLRLPVTFFGPDPPEGDELIFLELRI